MMRLVTNAIEYDEAADASSLRKAEGRVARRALDELAARQREVITLRYLAGLDDKEIDDATGLSPGGVRSPASRGLAQLRAAIGVQR